MKRFILVLFGHSCAGKTSVVEILMKKHENLFRISADKLKWLISKYDRKKHSKLIYYLLTTLANEVTKEKYSLIIEGVGVNLSNKGIKFFKSLSKKRKMKFIEINLESPFHIAKERFNKRLEESKKEKHKKISNRSHKRFKQLYEGYFIKKNKKMPTFNTHKSSSKQIVNRIEKLIS
ncbi:MAG: AAA family ATPase [Nanoarchaeota archaeon]|nr:AAA family ATPase [Nanoarchaeota archaeon]